MEILLILAREMTRRGHRVVFGSSPFYESMALDAGLEWVALGSGQRDELMNIMRELAFVADQRERVHIYAERWLKPQLSQAMPSIRSVLGACDYVVNNLKAVWKRGARVVPGATVIYDPPASAEGAARFAPQRIDHGGALLDVVAMNRALVDPEYRWPSTYCFTGFWFPVAARAWHPDPCLGQFMARGPAPFVLTMGSMVMLDGPSLMETFRTALRKSGNRGVVIAGWSGLDAAHECDESVHCAQEIPYDWLFPRARGVVHHGGCGSVAAVLRAGRPSIVLPRIISQEHFARLLADNGLAAAVLDADTLTVDDLCRAFDRVAGDDRFDDNAARWSELVTDDVGVIGAADALEHHFESLTG